MSDLTDDERRERRQTLRNNGTYTFAKSSLPILIQRYRQYAQDAGTAVRRRYWREHAAWVERYAKRREREGL